MKVVQFQRRPNGGSPSMERVFATVRDALTGAGIEVNVCPFESRGLFKRLYNSVDAALKQGNVNHITGDVHYLALVLRKSRTAITVHDCGTMLRLRGIRRLIFRWMWLELPIRRCSIVTVISEQTKRELLRYTSCPEHKIRVVPDPVGDEFRPAPSAFQADRPRILHVGSAANKNLDRLTAALSGIPCKLDIIGRISADAKKRLDHSGIEYECASGLSSAEVVAKYRKADLVAFCSTYEGFGMPIIEAQAVGRPVVTSNIEPMSGVAGGAACLVDPFDVDSIRTGILRVFRDPAYRDELVLRGFENVKRFSPEGVGRLYLGVYQELALSQFSHARQALGANDPA